MAKTRSKESFTVLGRKDGEPMKRLCKVHSIEEAWDRMIALCMSRSLDQMQTWNEAGELVASHHR